MPGVPRDPDTDGVVAGPHRRRAGHRAGQKPQRPAARGTHEEVEATAGLDVQFPYHSDRA